MNYHFEHNGLHGDSKQNVKQRIRNIQMNTYQKIDLVCERLEGYRLHNPKSAKLSYSGGRDSHLLLHLIRKTMGYSNADFQAVYVKTHNEFHEVRHRIEEQDITILDGGGRIFEIFKKEGLPLWSKDCSLNIRYAMKSNDQFKRYSAHWESKEGTQWDYRNQYYWCKNQGIGCSDRCCEILKEKTLGKAGTNIAGLRKDEGGRRSTGRNKEYDFCVKNSKVLFKPIFDISNSELTEIERALKIQRLNIYNYLDRTGCVMCGFGTKKQIAEKINYLRWYEPARAKFYMNYFKEYLKFRKIIF
jgi:3'-phosphoadenosine 5'-phosphosulfate sulfotransferase (PAPS reductase)/FAD synthetase